MIVNIVELINKRRNNRRSRNRIDTIDTHKSSSIAEAKAKVQAILDSGSEKRKKNMKNEG